MEQSDKQIVSLAPVFMPHAGETFHPFTKIRTWEIKDNTVYNRLQVIEVEMTRLMQEVDKLLKAQGVEILD